MAFAHAGCGYLNKLGTLAHFFDGDTTAIPHGSSNTPSHLVHDADHGAFVRHTTLNAFRYQFVCVRVAGGGFLEITVCAALLHGTYAAHAAIAFVAAALVQNNFARRFFGARKHTAHHDAGCTRCDGLGNIAAVTNSPIGNQGNAAALKCGSDIVDGGDLRHTDTGDDARGANRAWPDAYLDRIRTGFCQSQRRRTGGDVATDHINVGIVLLDPANPFDHAVAVTMCRIHDDGVYTGAYQSFHALFGARADAYRSPDTQSPCTVACSIRKTGLLGDVFDGDQTFEFKRIVDHQQAF